MHAFSLKKTVHGILTESYMVYMVALIMGVLTHSFFKVDWVTKGLEYFGVFCMLLGPVLMSWAQRASKKFKQIRTVREVTVEDFMYGPYRYVQSPTHMGIFLLAIGFSIVLNSAMLVFMVVLAYIVTHIVFIPCEQRILKRKYPNAYPEYIKRVKFSL